jgi:hypothetical protein
MEEEETVSWQINIEGFKSRGVHVGQCVGVRNCKSDFHHRGSKPGFGTLTQPQPPILSVNHKYIKDVVLIKCHNYDSIGLFIILISA